MLIKLNSGRIQFCLILMMKMHYSTCLKLLFILVTIIRGIQLYFLFYEENFFNFTLQS